MTNGYQKSVQALIKIIQVIAFIVAAIIVVVVVYSSISKEEISESEKIIFTPPVELLDAREGDYYSHSFCDPDSARSGATCGGLAGATENPYGGKPPYSFSHQFGVGFIPTGMALELNGLLRGAPTVPGKYTFGVCVTDLYEEVCKTTSLTVKPKSEQLIKEQLEEQVEEEVSPSVKIESATATFKDRDSIYPNNYWCTVKMSGTATLQAKKGGSGNLSFVGCFDDEIGDDQICSIKNADDDIANTIGSKLICPSWALYYEDECDRLPGQPAIGEWSLTFGDGFYPWRGYKRTYFTRVPGQSDWLWDSVTLTCQP